MKLDAYQTYCLFMAIKNHFTQKNYSFFKYKGKVRISKDKFMMNKDRFKYSRLSKKYDAIEMQDFILANILSGRKWIGEFMEDDAEQTYINYIKRSQSFTYTFKNDMDKIFSSISSPTKIFKEKNSTYPVLLELHMANDVNIESLCVLNSFIPFIHIFDKKLGEDDFIWSTIRNMIVKLTPFLTYDREKCKKILKDHINTPDKEHASGETVSC